MDDENEQGGRGGRTARRWNRVGIWLWIAPEIVFVAIPIAAAFVWFILRLLRVV